MSGNKDSNTTTSSKSLELIETSTSNLSNSKCAWGFRKMKDGKAPEFAKQFTDPLDKFNAIYIGNSEEPRVYLTFDEGYENGYSNAILDTLEEKDVPAAFFVTMPYAKQNTDLIKRMIDEGHIVGNHTVNHYSMPDVSSDEKVKQEILGLHDYLKDNFNYEMSYFRPPKGEYSERTLKLTNDLGYTTVMWSDAYADWDVNNQKGTEYAKDMILNYMHNGCVLLLHAVSKDNAEVLGEAIDLLREKGFEFYSLNEFHR